MATVLRAPRFIGTLAALLLAGPTLHADPARFDLVGPKVDVHVTRNNRTLPIAQVPNLLPGDKIWLHPDLPPTQSVHYLLVAAFLRGTTNPPPDNWFTEIQTWNKKVREEGVTITVPAEAQQVILFLAPETGGDFSTLRSAVRGRPGVFVQAPRSDIYVALLGVALAAMIIGCLLLVLILNRYGFSTKVSALTPPATPAAVVLAVTQSEPGVRGDTATGATKPARLETGITVNVPLFVNEGDKVKVDTRSGKYLERV